MSYRFSASFVTPVQVALWGSCETNVMFACIGAVQSEKDVPPLVIPKSNARVVSGFGQGYSRFKEFQESSINRS